MPLSEPSTMKKIFLKLERQFIVSPLDKYNLFLQRIESERQSELPQKTKLAQTEVIKVRMGLNIFVS